MIKRVKDLLPGERVFYRGRRLECRSFEEKYESRWLWVKDADNAERILFSSEIRVPVYAMEAK